MVKMRYTPTPFDLKASLVQLLKQIWNFNTHVDKYKCVDCLSFEEWCIDFAKMKWKADFVIRKIKLIGHLLILIE